MQRICVFWQHNGRPVLLFLAYTCLFYVFTQYLFFFLPFLLGALFALLLSPLCRRIHRKTKRSYKGTVLWFTALSLLLIFALLLSVLLLLARESVLLFGDNGYFHFDALKPEIQSYIRRMLAVLPTLRGDLTGQLSSLLPAVLPYAGLTLKALLCVPAVLLFPAVTYSFTCFLLLHKRRVRRLFSALLGPKIHLRLRHSVKAQTKASVGLVFSYTLIYLTTFAESCIILSLLQMPYPFTTAMVVTVSDIFPVLGPGAALFPLCLYRLLCGNAMQAIGLFVGWLLITVLRQIIEPRLISKVTRTPGLVMLAAVYAALLFGNFWLIPYTALLFYLYGLFSDAKLITKPTPGRKKSRPH